MSTTSENNNTSTPSQPIPIESRRRRRRPSESSDSSDPQDSPVLSPADSDSSPPRVAIRTSPLISPARLSPSTSPILSYFFPNALPVKSPMSVGRTAPGSYAPVVEDEDAPEPVLPAAAHARRLSNTWAAGSKMPPSMAPTDDRAASLMRRLSIGGTFNRPAIPSAGFGGDQGGPGALPPRQDIGPPAVRRARRSNTLAVSTASPKARAPSPMGERILKGHFDGFV